MPLFTRRRFSFTALVLLAASALPGIAGADTVEVRIGYQKSSTLTALLKAQGTLEKKFAGKDVHLSWSEFTSGAPLLEALNIGGIDLSADVADTVPIFALAAGANLAYYAQETPSPTAQAILVRADSPIHDVASLKGKKVAVAKAAGAHYLLIAALRKAGLKFSDIQPAYLSPADGRAAFENGSVDAWAVWDPYVAGAQQQAKARVLTDGTGIASYRRYYLASAPFAKAHPEIVQAVFDALRDTGVWVKAHPQDAAAALAPVWGLDAQTVRIANDRRSYEVRAVSADALGEQQKIADAFLDANLIPKAVDTQGATVWKPL
ncbi:MAG: sulfonate transporter substrate-binding protein [Nevskia sp.]|nr:sulfonate transporter substrate-binding protein [Nevskia sp.]